jgi:7-cyano-7-deazaguanine synthase
MNDRKNEIRAQKRAVVLLSGGIDSTTTLACAKRDGCEPYALSFSYGQRHAIELQAAARVAQAMGVAKHLQISFDLTEIGGSALTGNLPVPKGRSAEEMGNGIPVTYVPARNTIFLSFALAWAEVLGATEIYIGVNALDYSGYPDCREPYIRAFEKMAKEATKAGVQGAEINIRTPLVHLTKAEIIRLGVALSVDYSLTWSCYDPVNGLACGACDSCQLRRKGFQQAGVADPTQYTVATNV